jgi:hypothetical protein
VLGVSDHRVRSVGHGGHLLLRRELISLAISSRTPQGSMLNTGPGTVGDERNLRPSGGGSLSTTSEPPEGLVIAAAGEYLSGVLLRRVGVPTWLIMGGCLVLLAAGSAVAAGSSPPSR